MRTTTTRVINQLLFSIFSFLLISMHASATTYNVTVPLGTEACYITGSFTGWAMLPMTKIDDTHFTIDQESDVNDEYSYLSGPAWAYEQANEAGSPTSQAGWSENDVVVNWKNFYTNTPVVKVHVPANITECYIATSLDDWAFSPMNLVSTDGTGKIFSTTLTDVADPTALRYRFSASNGWANEQTNPSTEFAWVYGVVNTVNTFAGITTVINNHSDLLSIKKIDKSIEVRNFSSKVEIFNLMGRFITSSNSINNFTSKKLDTGIYIVKVDNYVQKVIIE